MMWSMCCADRDVTSVSDEKGGPAVCKESFWQSMLDY